jgi:glycosyltransferase involved in cell wall biosynthesis
VIGTLTGDLPCHLRDGENAFVCGDPSAGTLAAAIRRALSTSPKQRHRMRANARAEAMASFDVHVHVDALRDFIARAEQERRPRGPTRLFARRHSRA